MLCGLTQHPTVAKSKSLIESLHKHRRESAIRRICEEENLRKGKSAKRRICEKEEPRNTARVRRKSDTVAASEQRNVRDFIPCCGNTACRRRSISAALAGAVKGEIQITRNVLEENMCREKTRNSRETQRY